MSVNTSLENHAREVFRVFDKTVNTVNEHENVPTTRGPYLVQSVISERQRFHVWAVEMGILVPGRGSLDSRLTGALQIKAVVSMLLEDLLRYLNELKALFSVSEEDVDRHQLQVQDSADTDEERSESSISLESHCDIILQSTSDVLHKLFKLAHMIRDPRNRIVSHRASTFTDVDEDSGKDLIQEFEHYDKQHISNLLSAHHIEFLQANHNIDFRKETIDAFDIPPTHRYLTSRLAKANTRRRQEFLYQRSHRTKLESRTATALDVEPTPAQAGARRSEVGAIPLKQGPPQVSTEHSVTTASKLPPHLTSNRMETEPLSDRRSDYTASRYTASGVVHEFPPPPNLDKSGQQAGFFSCPYCLTSCPARLAEPGASRAHVIHDLRPYVCTFPDCSEETRTFDRLEEWTQHEVYSHQLRWCCPSHPERVYDSRQSFSAHMDSTHGDELDGTSREAFFRICEMYPSAAGRDCPICLTSIGDFWALQKHIGKDLVRISLFALPRSSPDDELDSGIGSTQSKVAAIGAADVRSTGSRGREDLTNVSESSEVGTQLFMDSGDSTWLATHLTDDHHDENFSGWHQGFWGILTSRPASIIEEQRKTSPAVGITGRYVPLMRCPHPGTTEPALTDLHNNLCMIQSRFPGWCSGIAQKSWFICEDALYDLLSETYVLGILRVIFRNEKDDAQLRVLARSVIDKECRKIFAILSTAGLGYIITHVLDHSNEYRDGRLPVRLDHFVSVFACDPAQINDLWRLQHHFCVQAMSERLDNSISENVILPIRNREFLKSGSTADVYKIELHEGYNHFAFRAGQGTLISTPASNTFVVKTFSADRKNAKQYFEAEVRAYNTLASDAHPEPNTIRYYGSFEVRNSADTVLSYDIILEHAGERTLEDLFVDSRREVPSNARASWMFWRQLFGLARGLDRLHEFQRSEALRGMHHDLKPDNILILDNPDSSLEAFPYRFAIADLGLVTMQGERASNGIVGGRRGAAVYSAPETDRESWRDDWRLEAGPASDIWALGCILSEGFVWSALGYAGLANYRDLRSASSGDLGPMFHDGYRTLSVIREQHRKAVECIEKGDHMAMIISDLIRISDLIEDMLSEEQARPSAMQVSNKANRILAHTKPDFGEEEIMRPRTVTRIPESVLQHLGSSKAASASSTSIDLNHTTTIRRRPSASSSRTSKVPDRYESEASQSASSAPLDVAKRQLAASPQAGPRRIQYSEPCILISQLRDWKQKTKDKTQTNLPQIQYLEALRGRHTIFVIDDSQTMRQYWPQVVEWLQVVGYAMKQYDPDEMEFAFLSGGKTQKASTSTELARKVQLHSSSGSTPKINAEVRLAGLFHSYVEMYQDALHGRSRRSLFGGRHVCRRINYYVLTDGVWEPHGCNVSRAILNLLQGIDGSKDDQVGISFIQFGSDPVGTARLSALDDGMVEVKGASRDIVDFEPFQGNVLKMLLAPMSDLWNKENRPSAKEKAAWLWE